MVGSYIIRQMARHEMLKWRMHWLCGEQWKYKCKRNTGRRLCIFRWCSTPHPPSVTILTRPQTRETIYTPFNSFSLQEMTYTQKGLHICNSISIKHVFLYAHLKLCGMTNIIFLFSELSSYTLINYIRDDPYWWQLTVAITQIYRQLTIPFHNRPLIMNNKPPPHLCTYQVYNRSNGRVDFPEMGRSLVTYSSHTDCLFISKKRISH